MDTSTNFEWCQFDFWDLDEFVVQDVELGGDVQEEQEMVEPVDLEAITLKQDSKDEEFLLENLKELCIQVNEVIKKNNKMFKSDSIQKVQNGLGISIISTSKGIFSDNEAREKKLGGEVLCKVS